MDLKYLTKFSICILALITNLYVQVFLHHYNTRLNDLMSWLLVVDQTLVYLLNSYTQSFKNLRTISFQLDI